MQCYTAVVCVSGKAECALRCDCLSLTERMCAERACVSDFESPEEHWAVWVRVKEGAQP